MAFEEVQESKLEMEQILQQETVGYLGVVKDGRPYVVPLNYVYADGKIIFHCALSGMKLDYMKTTPLVCFTVGRLLGPVQPHPEGNPCQIDNDSVICYGRARLIENLDERKAALEQFDRRYEVEVEPLSREVVAKCGAVEITITEMTGRQQRGGERSRWLYRFEK